MAEGLPEAIESLPAGLDFWAEQTPHALALRAIDGRTLTHGELHQTLRAIATTLAARAIAETDRVALVVPTGLDGCLALLGTICAGVAAPLHAGSTVEELLRDLARLSPRLVITSDELPAGVEAADRLGIPRVDVAELVQARMGVSSHAVFSPLPPRHGDDIAVILHTSGTTGLPKRVPRPHRTFVATSRLARASTSLTPADVCLTTAGLHTNAGVANILNALLTGGACVVAPRTDPARFPTWLEQHQPTWMVTTATELNLILGTAEVEGRDSVAGPSSRLRIIRTGAQPLTPGTLERAERSFRALVMDGLGMTEASYITASGPTLADRRAGSCGRIQQGTVRILDETGGDLPAGATGEVVIRTPTLFPGYLDDPVTNAAIFLPGGWFRTGDIGYLDTDDFLYLVGRRNELINRGGEKIAPLEVDRALLIHPAVADAAAFAMPDPRLGEDIVAAVVLKPGQQVTARALRRWLLDRLATHKTPRRIWFTDQLPRTPTGKVQRGELARRFQSEESDETPPALE